ncbi:MAG: helix-turn-helix transcriptional regulator [Syntrophales bacterium]|nr:helix-turn-helix transcriptional regulator [Syntrophales bacterium]
MKRDLQENSACQTMLLDIRKMFRELETISLQVSQVNSAINSLFKRENEHKKDTEEKILINVKEIVLPCLKELKKSPLAEEQTACVELAEKYLREILSPFVNNVTSKYLSLSPREIQVANLVKEGKTSKEISSLMNISSEAVDIHRNRIRKKLGLSNRKVNLQGYLMSFSNG